MDELFLLSGRDVLKEQIVKITHEIRKYSTRLKSLKECQSVINGFDCPSSFESRNNLLCRSTRPGKPIGKPSQSLIIGILEALRSSPRRELELKEILVRRFLDQGLRVSNRSILAGTSLDVSSVCAILSHLGVIEQYDDTLLKKQTDDSSLGAEFESNTLLDALLTGIILRCELNEDQKAYNEQEHDDLLGDNSFDVDLNGSYLDAHKFENDDNICRDNIQNDLVELMEDIENEEGDRKESNDLEDIEINDESEEGSSSTDDSSDEDYSSSEDNDNQDDGTLNLDETSIFSDINSEHRETQPKKSKDQFALSEEENQFSQQKSDSFNHTDSHSYEELGLKLSQPASESTSSDDNSVSGCREKGSIQSSDNWVPSSSFSRKVNAAPKWKLASKVLLPADPSDFPLVSQPGPQLSNWAEVAHKCAVAKDIERRTLVRALALCGGHANLGIPSWHLTYLLPDNEIDSLLSHYPHSTSTDQDSFTRYLPPSAESGLQTARALLDKIGYTRRQQGASLSCQEHVISSLQFNVPIFSEEKLSVLKMICNRTSDAFWKNEAEREKEKEKEAQSRNKHSSGSKKRSFMEEDDTPITVVEYARSINSKSVQALPSSLSLTSLGSGAQTGVTLTNTSGLIHSGSANNSYGIQPDILLAGQQPCINMLALRRYAPEQYYEEVVIDTKPIPWDNLAPEFGPVPIEESADFVDGMSIGLLSRVEDSFFHGTNMAAATPNSASGGGGTVSRSLNRKVISDVQAPQFREVRSPNSMSARQQGNIVEGASTHKEEVELTEEQYLNAHENVLRQMREKWARLQQLKCAAGLITPSGPSKGGGNGKGNLLRRVGETGNLEGQHSVAAADGGLQVKLPSNFSFSAEARTVSALSPVGVKKRGRPPKLQKVSHASQHI